MPINLLFKDVTDPIPIDISFTYLHVTINQCLYILSSGSNFKLLISFYLSNIYQLVK